MLKFQVSIQEDTDRNHALHLDTEFPSKGSWEDDWEGTVPQCVELDFPCFILYRLDEKDASGNYMWILISWSPDIAHTRFGNIAAYINFYLGLENNLANVIFFKAENAVCFN